MICSLTAWWYWQQQKQQQTEHTDVSHQLDFYMQGVTATRFDKQGQLVSSLYSPKVTHYPHQDTYLLENPDIQLREENNPQPWQIRAYHGKALHQMTYVELWEDVRIHQNNSSAHPTTTILTSFLIVKPKIKYAETDKPVTFLQPGTRINSIGMRAYFNQQKVELLSHARGYYANNNQSNKAHHS